MAYLGNSPANALFNLTPPIELAQGQTVVTVNYTPGRVTWFKNGAMLIPTVDITATDGSTATLASPANDGDVLWAVNFASFKVADALSLSGGTLGGPLTGPSSATESVAGLAKFATTAEAQAMTARDVALSPGGLADAFGGSAKSVSQTSWYQKLPGGLIIQGGQQNGPSTGANGTETIVYPIPFPTMAVALFGNELTVNPADVTTMWAQSDITNRAQGTLNWKKDSGSGSAGIGLYGWIAFGF